MGRGRRTDGRTQTQWQDLLVRSDSASLSADVLRREEADEKGKKEKKKEKKKREKKKKKKTARRAGQVQPGHALRTTLTYILRYCTYIHTYIHTYILHNYSQKISLYP